MLYIIPFVILLVVMLILKKRENANKNQNNEKNKKITSKKVNKKTISRNVRPSTSVQDAVSSPSFTPTQKELNPELKSDIEHLIQTQNYPSAEAKINQALNQDNTQHELYLYLIDIHLAQKDEFATKQLINYLHSLNLKEIADLADQKYQQANLQTSTPSHSSQSYSSPRAEPTSNSNSNSNSNQFQSNAAFDALIDSDLEAKPVNFSAEKNQSHHLKSSFESIEYTVDQKESEKSEHLQSLDFVAPTALSTHEVNVQVSDNTQIEAPISNTNETIIEPLEFSFDSPATQTEVHPSAPVSDFEFAEKTEEAHDLKAEEAKFNLEFNLPHPTSANPTPAEPASSITAPSTPTAEFNFDFDLPQTQTNQFNFEHSVENKIAPQVEAITVSTDPLAQSFPEILQVNEIQLNLDLAERYIALGAYDSAKQLLAQNEQDYTIGQRERSQKLLNKIAS